MLPVNVTSCILFSIFLLKFNLISYGAAQHSSARRVSCALSSLLPSKAGRASGCWTSATDLSMPAPTPHCSSPPVYRREQKGKKEARKDKDKKADSEEQDKSREEDNDDDDERMEEEEQNDEEEVDN